MLEILWQDVRYAFRHLQRSPAFASTAILTLALGIGANAGMFAILNAIVLRPLAIADPGGLIGVSGRGTQGELRLTPIPALDELADGPFQPVCGYNGGVILAVEAGGTPTQAVGALMTSRCLDVFGVAPILGRPLLDEDAPIHEPGRHVALISHAFWSRMFGADPAAVGRTIKTEGIELTIIGVLPPGFGGLHADSGAEIFAPFDTIYPAGPTRRPGASHLLGRLRPGISLEQARAQIGARWPAILEAVVPPEVAAPEREVLRRAWPQVERIGTGLSFFRDQYTHAVTLVLGLALLLLLMTCANLGGLLSRLSARSAELSIRQALGAGRWRISRQMLIESLLLSMAGAVLAIPVSLVIVATLASLLPQGLVARTVELKPDPTVLAATALVGLVTGALIGTLPVWVANHREMRMAPTCSRTVAGSTSGLARGLVVLQVALSVVMLAGAVLLLRSLYLLQHVDPGVRTENILSVRAMPLPSGYAGIDNGSYYPALIERLRGLPGVQSVGAGRMFSTLVVEIPGSPIAIVGEPDAGVTAIRETASPEFFDTLGIPLVEGRGFSWADTAASQQVAILSKSLARQLAPDGDIIGRRIRHGRVEADQDVVVVGVVGNATMGNPRQADLEVIYRPMLQAGRFANYPSVQLHVTGDIASVVSGIRQAFMTGGREYPHTIDRLSDVLARAPSSERMSATVGGAMGVLAVLLAIIGLHGLLAHGVTRRTREIGLRMAVGADPLSVVSMVLREGLVLTLAGLMIGVPVALVAARSLRFLMFGITEWDPVTIIATILLFTAVGLGASLIPARRAASVDPMVALRAE